MKRRVAALLGVVGAIVLTALITFTMSWQSAQGQQRQPDRVTDLPEIISKISSLELISAKIENVGTPDASASLEIRNNADKSIIAVALESGDDKDATGTNLNGFNDGDAPPSIIVKPHETFKIGLPLANLRPGFPIRISGVMYADGTEEGEKASLGTMHRQKEHYKTKRKGEPKQ